LLVDLVSPLIRQARAAREISGWFFLRYVDGPGRRPHLRVRVRGVKGGEARFSRRLDRHLAPAFASGDIVAVERTQYFPERARFGGPSALEAAHALFEADSDLACALLSVEAEAGIDPDPDDGAEGGDGARDRAALDNLLDLPDFRVLCLVSAFDTLARGLGLDDRARRELAQRRYDAHASDMEADAAREHGRAFRTVGPQVRNFLGGVVPSRIAAALDDYRARAAQSVAAARLDADACRRLLAPLLHLSAVRLLGTDRPGEIRGYAFWSRALDSLARHPS
jgi:hypothetical protein